MINLNRARKVQTYDIHRQQGRSYKLARRAVIFKTSFGLSKLRPQETILTGKDLLNH